MEKISKDQKRRKPRKREWENTDLFAFFSLPNISLYCNHKISAIYTADCIYKLRHMIIESFGSEGTPGGFFIYSQKFSTQICLHHTRNGFLTQTRNNRSIMSLLGNVAKALKSLLKFLGQQASQAVWQLQPTWGRAARSVQSVPQEGLSSPSPCAAQEPLSRAQPCCQQQLPNCHIEQPPLLAQVENLQQRCLFLNIWTLPSQWGAGRRSCITEQPLHKAEHWDWSCPGKTLTFHGYNMAMSWRD